MLVGAKGMVISELRDLSVIIKNCVILYTAIIKGEFRDIVLKLWSFIVS